MKKLFNYALMAAALLVGVNVNAENVSSFAQLKAAVEAGTDANITLTANIEYPVNEASFPVYGLVVGNGQTVTIDLNGYTITRDNVLNATPAQKKDGFMFSIVKGTLHLTGEGSLIGKGDVHTGFATIMGGNFIKFENGIVYCDNPAKSQNMPEAGLGGAPYGIKKWNKTSQVYECQGMASIIFMVGTAEHVANHSNLIVDENVNLLNEDGKAAVQIYVNTGSAPYKDIPGIQTTKRDGKQYANGVNIDIAGYLKSYQYGIQVSGNVKKDETDTQAEYVPYILIRPTAQLVVASDWAECTGIYCAGYAKWDIQGKVQGSTGAYIKSGDVTFTDATIESTNTNTTTTQGKGSGIAAGGTGIVIEGNSSYAGGMDVTIEGDTKVTGASGYGIEQVITSGDAADLEQLNITGGTIEGGEQGGIIVENENKEEIVIAGGSSSEATITVKDDQGETTEIGIDQFFPQDGESYHTTTIDNGDGTTTTVVTKGDEPEKVTLVESDDIMDYEGKSINFNGSTVEQELTNDLNLKELSMVDATEDEKLVVPDDVTLHVEKLIMGPNANITVAKGGTLIVDGEQGIVAKANGNIVVEAEEGQMGQFLFNPEVTSNRHPKATVTLISHSFGNAQEEDYMNQFFGMPMVKVESITMDKGADVAARFSIWRYDHWETVGYINRTPALNYSKFNIPFGICDIASNNFENDWITFDITGELLGNDDPSNFRILKGWTSAANAWTGNCDVAALQERIADLEDRGVKQYVYNYEYKDHVVTWNPIDETLNPQTTIAPLQPIMLCSDGDAFASNVMNYNELVWNPAQNVAKAPRRSIDMNAVAIRITDENGVSDAMAIKEAPEFDGGKNAPKYMNEVLCVYADTDEKLAVLASDDVDNTFIGFNCAKAGKYTVSFYNVRGENFVLVDLVNNARIEMAEGVTYEFNAMAGENAHRFMVVDGAKAPTNNAQVKAAAKAMKVISGSEFRIVKEGRAFNAIGAEL